jgi:two-component sensor histidine kinase
LSFIDIESSDRTGISGRTPLAGVQRRLHILALLHSQLHNENRLSGLDFQPFVQSLVDVETLHGTRPSGPAVEYWGVPVEVDLEKALPLALAVAEMVDLARAPRFAVPGAGPVQVILSDNPRCLSVGRQGLALAFEDQKPLEWQVVETLAAQLGGRALVQDGVLKLEF